MANIAMIGYFFGGKSVSEGQGIKTKILADEIERAVGSHSLRKVDTYGWKKHPLKLIRSCVCAVRKSDHVLFAVDEGGIKVFPWLLRCANIFGKCKLHYIVVGGWLVHFLQKHKFIRSCLKGIDGIYVETHIMKQRLEQMGFRNVLLMPNCKPLQPLTERELVYTTEAPYRLCIFSRVMKEKGIEEAVAAVRNANAHYGKTVFTLDIYGLIDSRQTEWFRTLSDTFPPEIRYCGLVPYDQSVAVIKDYYALLFPTKFYTEGNPGTLIDAYASGVPVIASEWENYADMIVPGVTGITYPFSSPERLNDILIEIAADPNKLNNMKKHCLERAMDYLPSNTVGILLNNLNS